MAWARASVWGSMKGPGNVSERRWGGGSGQQTAAWLGWLWAVQKALLKALEWEKLKEKAMAWCSEREWGGLWVALTGLTRALSWAEGAWGSALEKGGVATAYEGRRMNRQMSYHGRRN